MLKGLCEMIYRTLDDKLIFVALLAPCLSRSLGIVLQEFPLNIFIGREIIELQRPSPILLRVL